MTVAEASKDFAVRNALRLHRQYMEADRDLTFIKHQHVPCGNEFEVACGIDNIEEQMEQLKAMLRHANLKAGWEKKGRWRGNV